MTDSEQALSDYADLVVERDRLMARRDRILDRVGRGVFPLDVKAISAELRETQRRFLLAEARVARAAVMLPESVFSGDP